MKVVHVVCAVIEQENKIFATQRGYGEFKGGWEFPGGKIEAGESEQEALKREIKEELDTEIEVMDKICTVDYDYEAFHLTMECYFAKIISGKLSLLEHMSSCWLDRDNLFSVDWLAADIQLIKQLQASPVKEEK